MTVTWLEAGMPPLVVSKRLGHTSVAFTPEVLASVSDELQRGAVAQAARFKAH